MTRCKGCGITLQDKDKNGLGYVEDINSDICRRCFRLSHYGEYKTVSLDNSDYKKIIKSIPDDSLVVYICDILSLDIYNLDNYNNILLVITKRDIMPKSVKDYKLIEYIKRKVNVLDIVIISSNKNYNIDNLYTLIEKYSKGRDVYFVGNTNSGKSTLINKLQKNYSNSSYNDVTVSMYPSTTLDKVIIKIGSINIVDTPGIIDNGNIINYLNSKELKKVIPKKEIKPKSCQIRGKGSIVIDNFARIDYESVNDNSMVIYGANSLNIRFNSIKKDNLLDLNCTCFNLDNNKDIVIPGLCFIKFVGSIKVKVYTFENVVPYERDNLI